MNFETHVSAHRQDWIVTPWQPAGLAVGDFVEAHAAPDDIWTGEIRGYVQSIHTTASTKEIYAYVDLGDDTGWDVGLEQIKVTYGQRRISLYRDRTGQPGRRFQDELVSFGNAAYHAVPLSLFTLDLGLLHVCVQPADAPELEVPSAYVLLQSQMLTFDSGINVWEPPLALFRDLDQVWGKQKPSEVEIEIVHPGKEAWGWEQSFPLQLCSTDGNVYVCVGKRDSIPDVEDMTNLEDDCGVWT